MQQVWIPRIGDPDVLELRDAPDPDPAQGEVRVRVRAAGVNFADIMARMGLYNDSPPLPAVVGYEVSGVVDAIGDGVEGFSIGDRVLALTRFGGYSSVICAPAMHVHPIPEHLSFEGAAGVPVNYLTAWLMLVALGNVQAADRVLIHAAAGGVGQAALQICKWRGATTYGTASAPKHPRLKEMGLDHCIDYRSQDFEAEVSRLTDGQGVEIVLDAVGGASFKKSYRCLAPMGRLFLFGASSVVGGEKRQITTALKSLVQMPRFSSLKLMDENRGVLGVNIGHLWDRADRINLMLQEIMQLLDDGTFTPLIDATFPLAQANEAHRYIQDRKNFGKVVLTCEG